MMTRLNWNVQTKTLTLFTDRGGVTFHDVSYDKAILTARLLDATLSESDDDPAI